ncbi:MAG: head GIN domain-containing protein [Chitinophagaceae bacterium]
MKKIFYSLLLLTLGQVALAQPNAIKDPNVQLREAKNFTVIRLSNAFDVFLSQSNEESVAVSASDREYLEDIKVEVKNGVLEIYYKPKKGWGRGDRKLKAYISFKQLDKLDVSGACDVDIVGVWKADGAKIELSGASDLTGQVNITKLSFDLSGASDVKLTGTVGRLEIDASGASSFKCYDLAADYCTADVSGASDVRIQVNKEMSITASGASDVRYKGEGTIRDIRTSGASSVKRGS